MTQHISARIIRPAGPPADEAKRRSSNGVRYGVSLISAITVKSEDGKTSEWKSKSLRAYQARTKSADALIAGAYLAGTNTRIVRRAAKSAFARAVSKDVVSRTFDWGRLGRAFARGRADHPPHSRWRGHARAARQVAHLDLASRRARRETGRAESPARDQEHGRREQGRLAGAARRSDPTRIEDVETRHRRWRAGAREPASRVLVRCAGSAVLGAQTP